MRLVKQKRNIFLKKLASVRVFPYGIDERADDMLMGHDHFDDVLERLTGAYSAYDRVLGVRAAEAALALYIRPLLLARIFVKVLQITVLITGIRVYGVMAGLACWLLVYILTRPVVWFVRRSLLCLSESITRRQILTLGENVYGRLMSRCSHYSLLKNANSIPGKSLVNGVYSKTFVDFLPKNQEVREVALKLADQYEGSLADLVACSKILAQ